MKVAIKQLSIGTIKIHATDFDCDIDIGRDGPTATILLLSLNIDSIQLSCVDLLYFKDILYIYNNHVPFKL